MAITMDRQLEQALIDVGLVPDKGRLLEIVVTPRTPTIIRYEILVAKDDLKKLATAFAAAADAREQSASMVDRSKS